MLWRELGALGVNCPNERSFPRNSCANRSMFFSSTLGPRYLYISPIVYHGVLSCTSSLSRGKTLFLSSGDRKRGPGSLIYIPFHEMGGDGTHSGTLRTASSGASCRAVPPFHRSIKSDMSPGDNFRRLAYDTGTMEQTPLENEKPPETL